MTDHPHLIPPLETPSSFPPVSNILTSTLAVTTPKPPTSPTSPTSSSSSPHPTAEEKGKGVDRPSSSGTTPAVKAKILQAVADLPYFPEIPDSSSSDGEVGGMVKVNGQYISPDGPRPLTPEELVVMNDEEQRAAGKGKIGKGAQQESQASSSASRPGENNTPRPTSGIERPISKPGVSKTFTIVRLIENTDKAGNNMAPSINLRAAYFAVDLGDFLLDLSGQKTEIAQVRNYWGEERYVPRRMLQAIYQPWDIPAKIGIVDVGVALPLATLRESRTAAEVLGNVDFEEGEPVMLMGDLDEDDVDQRVLITDFERHAGQVQAGILNWNIETPWGILVTQVDLDACWSKKGPPKLPKARPTPKGKKTTKRKRDEDDDEDGDDDDKPAKRAKGGKKPPAKKPKSKEYVDEEDEDDDVPIKETKRGKKVAAGERLKKDEDQVDEGDLEDRVTAEHVVRANEGGDNANDPGEGSSKRPAGKKPAAKRIKTQKSKVDDVIDYGEAEAPIKSPRGGKLPSGKTVAGKKPASKKPADLAHFAHDEEGVEAPFTSPRAGKMPSGKMVAGKKPVGTTLAEETPAGKKPAGKTTRRASKTLPTSRRGSRIPKSPTVAEFEAVKSPTVAEMEEVVSEEE